MKTFKMVLVMVLMVGSLAVLGACGTTDNGNNGDPGNPDNQNTSVYGSEIDKTKYEKATVDGILTSPTDEYFDKDVVIDAVITKICPAGCWFYVKDYGSDSSVELYIDKYKDRFLVPQGIEGQRINLYGHVEADVKMNILAAVRMELVK